MRVTQLVERVLRDQPETRSSDKKLILAVWEEQGLYLSESQKARFMSLPSTETIRRIRQKEQELGKFKADRVVKDFRYWKSLTMQQNTPSAMPKTIENVIEQTGFEL